MEITLIKSLYLNFNSIKLKQNQLIYATDTKNVVYDIDNKLRFSLSCTRQYITDSDRLNSTPQENIIYIVVNDNQMYRYYNDLGWLNIIDFETVQDLIISAEELIPMVIENNGIKYAPKTLAQYIYMNDGSTLQSNIESLMKKGSKVILRCDTKHVQLKYDKQKLIDIPYPIPNYDIYTFPILVILRKEKLDIDVYALGKDQLILSDSIIDANKKDDVVTFIFVYAETLSDSSLDCESINGVRIFKGANDLALDLRQDKDLMINTTYGEIKEWCFNTQEWKVLFSNRKRLVKRIENIETFTKPTNYVNINIPGFDSEKDSLKVTKNGIELDESVDYFISGDNTFIKPPTGNTWDVTDKTTFKFVVYKNLPLTTYDEYDNDNFNENEIVNLKSELGGLRSEVLALKDIISKFNI